MDNKMLLPRIFATVPKNLNIVYLILLAEVALLSGGTIIDFFRRRVFLKVSTLVDISLISDFFVKLMKLPMKFFYIKLPGDILQRIEDHTRIENFLTDQSPRLVFSAFNIVTFGFVLAFYSWKILVVFVLGNLLYVLWIFLFLNKRRILDYQYFEKQANQRDVVYQMITGMPEIKIQGCERRKREQWRKVQEDIFGINLKSLTLNQYEEAGGICITELTNIVVVIIAATSVISGSITLGVMLAVQSIIGQLRAPMDDIMSFIYQWQDVNISMDRINEIHSMKNEEEEYGCIKDINDVNIEFHNVSFQYDLSEEKNVLNHITLRIPQNKVTAIVGASGSGKTTLVKLLLGHFLPTEGCVTIGGIDIQHLDLRWWRSLCGAVMQDGVIFPESIAQNIGLTDSTQDGQKLIYAANKACILDYVNSLPLGFNTMLYQDGMNLSNGQRQRILIARAIYRNPRLFVFDEATNSLDANTESVIVRNLKTVFQNKTVVVVAHRLSTVREADNIIVLDQGKIIEQGNHDELISIKGYYYRLVRNQLEE
ncbi:peptidase domain-containing ABC transporter [Prevotella sp. KH2C16]|uniref:peptidase domain-containing ABC transporter n=1 Tax=Prevotella sp. KH2C16 TaxID=1855325 RepID=UPI000B89C42A|nr:peptidase domain-containing ABC transporter [Prevotella sp. KH2C16]